VPSPLACAPAPLPPPPPKDRRTAARAQRRAVPRRLHHGVRRRDGPASPAAGALACDEKMVENARGGDHHQAAVLELHKLAARESLHPLPTSLAAPAAGVRGQRQASAHRVAAPPVLQLRDAVLQGLRCHACQLRRTCHCSHLWRQRTHRQLLVLARQCSVMPLVQPPKPLDWASDLDPLLPQLSFRARIGQRTLRRARMARSGKGSTSRMISVVWIARSSTLVNAKSNFKPAARHKLLIRDT